MLDCCSIVIRVLLFIIPLGFELDCFEMSIIPILEGISPTSLSRLFEFDEIGQKHTVSDYIQCGGSRLKGERRAWGMNPPDERSQ